MKIAVIGLGSAGKRHANHLRAFGHDVVGFDPAMPHIEAVEPAESFHDAIEICDAAVIASPTSLHESQTMAVLARGKHVLVEKPLATTVAGAERVAEEAARAGAVCAVAMNMRFHAAIVELKRLVDRGQLGVLRFVQASFGYDLRLWRPEQDYRRGYSARSELGGGIVLDAIHELDYLLWLAGPVATVSAHVARVSDLDIDVEDVAVAALGFDSGAAGSVDLNFFEPAYRRGCLVVGSEAVGRWDWRGGVVTVSRAGENDRIVAVPSGFADTYRAELVDFLDAVELGARPRTPASHGVDAVRFADAVKRAAASGRRVAVSNFG